MHYKCILNKFKEFIIVCNVSAVNGAVHYDVREQNALVTVLNVAINYIPNCLREIQHTVCSAATYGKLWGAECL
jgi:hypothetical protein